MVGRSLECGFKIYINLERQGLIRASQYDFFGGRSCHTNLVVFFVKVTHPVHEDRSI